MLDLASGGKTAENELENWIYNLSNDFGVLHDEVWNGGDIGVVKSCDFSGIVNGEPIILTTIADIVFEFGHRSVPVCFKTYYPFGSARILRSSLRRPSDRVTVIIR